MEDKTVEELNEELEEAIKSKDFWYGQYSESKAELEQLQYKLDGIYAVLYLIAPAK